MKFQVVLQRVSDGKTVVVDAYGEWSDDPDDDPTFYWTEGNGGCDCNRHDAFEVAEGRQNSYQLGTDPVCGETAYRLIEYRLADGRVIPGGET